MLAAQCGAAGNIAGLIEAVRSTGSERTGAWYYATPEDTRARLERAGFEDVEVWTHPEPTRLAEGRELETYLETVCLRTHVDGHEPRASGPGSWPRWPRPCPSRSSTTCA